MVTVDVRELLNPNVDELSLDIQSSRIKCRELLEHCRQLLALEGDYLFKHNEVFLHLDETVADGDTVVLVSDREQE